MKILKLSANNFLNLRAIDLTPNGDSLILSGKNGAGKSSILRAIQAGLGGKDASPEDPIRHGQKRAEIIVQTEKWTAKRVYTAKGERLELLSNDGAAYKSPQGLLDQVLGDISFDPLAFAKLDVPRQRGVVLRLAKLDFTKYDADRTGHDDERRICNRNIKALKARLEALPPDHEGLPEKTIATKDLMDELTLCEAEAQQYQQVLLRKSGAEATIRDLQSKQERLENELQDVRCQLEEAKSQLSYIVIPEDTFTAQRGEIRRQMETMEQTNEGIRKRDMRRALIGELQEAQSQADTLTKQMDAIDEKKMKELMEAKYPLDGLMLNDEAVLFNGTRLDQLSDGEAIRVSVAVAMALNPDLRVILIRNGSLLDEDGKAQVFAMAQERGYQVWLEEVDESGQIGIYIEDGTIAAVDGVPVPVPVTEGESEGMYD